MAFIHKLPLPKNPLLRIFVALIYISLALYLLPFLIGGLIVYFIYKKSDGKTLKYGLSGLILLLTFSFGSAWIAGFSGTSTTQSSTAEVKPEVPTATQNTTIPSAPEITATLTPAPTVTNTPVPTKAKVNTPTPTKKIIYPTATPSYESTGLSNDNYYTNSAGNEVHSPAYSNSVPAGATAICGDGTYSFSQSRRGTCSHHGGVSQWL